MASTTRKVDYDQIAQLYDEPGRDFGPDPDLLCYMEEHPCSASLRVLDMGCGTGKQLAADHATAPALQFIGLDLFHGMLSVARKRCEPATWIQGDSASPPFVDASFDYITNQFSYHHIRDKTRLIFETYRLLKPGGRFAITNLDPWSMDRWIVYRYFPASRRCDLADFLPENELVSIMQASGFRDIRVRRELERREETLGDFLAYASQRHRTSHLMEIDDQEYDEGLRSIRESIDRIGAQARVPSELCLIWFTSDKPTLGRAGCP